MISHLKSGAVLGAVLAASAIASPVAVPEVQPVPALQERGLLDLGVFALLTSHEKDVILDLYVLVLTLVQG